MVHWRFHITPVLFEIASHQQICDLVFVSRLPFLSHPLRSLQLTPLRLRCDQSIQSGFGCSSKLKLKGAEIELVQVALDYIQDILWLWIKLYVIILKYKLHNYMGYNIFATQCLSQSQTFGTIECRWWFRFLTGYWCGWLGLNRLRRNYWTALRLNQSWGCNRVRERRSRATPHRCCKRCCKRCCNRSSRWLFHFLGVMNHRVLPACMRWFPSSLCLGLEWVDW